MRVETTCREVVWRRDLCFADLGGPSIWEPYLGHLDGCRKCREEHERRLRGLGDYEEWEEEQSLSREKWAIWEGKRIIHLGSDGSQWRPGKVERLLYDVRTSRVYVDLILDSGLQGGNVPPEEILPFEHPDIELGHDE